MRILIMIGLIGAIVRGAWAIEPNVAHNYLPIVASLLQGEANWQANMPGMNEEGYRYPYVVDANGNMIVQNAQQPRSQFDYTGLKGSTEEGYLVLPVEDVIMKGDYCGGLGTMSQEQILRRAEQDENIKGLIINIDSPGGYLSGTSTLADRIHNFSKPTISFIDDGMMASAAYWIGSAADKVVASQRTDEVGSIGVYTTLADFRGFYEEQGIKIKYIYAPQSTEKNKDWKEAMENDNDAPTEASLKFMAAEFIKTVKRHRGDKIEDDGKVYKGALYNAVDAKKLGLIDRIGNFDSVLRDMNSLVRKANTLKVKIS